MIGTTSSKKFCKFLKNLSNLCHKHFWEKWTLLKSKKSHISASTKLQACKVTSDITSETSIVGRNIFLAHLNQKLNVTRKPWFDGEHSQSSSQILTWAYLMSNWSITGISLWHRRQNLWWVFSFRVLTSNGTSNYLTKSVVRKCHVTFCLILLNLHEKKKKTLNDKDYTWEMTTSKCFC